MKIAFLLPSLKFGGAERVSLNLAKEMKNLGNNIDFLVMSKEGEFLSEAELNFNVHDLKCKKTYQLPYKLLHYYIKNKPNLIISNFWKLNICACLSRIIYPWFKLILWEHAPPSKSPISPIWLYLPTASFFYQFSTKIVAVSNGVKDDILKNTIGLTSKLVTIYNAITPPVISEERLIAKKNRKNNQIISVGRLARQKNPELLIEAFALISNSTNANLLIVGEGYLRNDLEILSIKLGLKDRVKFYGFSNYPYDLIFDSDLLVLTSDFEGLPTVLIEALYCGLSIVSTDCPSGPREILMNGKYGSLVPMGDKVELAKAILFELNNLRFFEDQINAANRFLPSVIAKKFLDIIS